MRTGIAVVIVIIAIVGTGGGIYFYKSCTEQRDDITRKTGTLAGSIEGLLGLIDNSLIQQIERYNSQCGWLTGVFNLGGGSGGEPALSPEVAESEFLDNYYSLVNASTMVTENYHKEIEKWERDEYDDRELVTITDSFLPQYDLLLDRASGFDAPQRYQEALDLYISGLRSERASYTLFRDFIETGDPRLNETSVDLLTNATKYELESFNLIDAERQATDNNR
jgi:hypothetical protein